MTTPALAPPPVWDTRREPLPGLLPLAAGVLLALTALATSSAVATGALLRQKRVAELVATSPVGSVPLDEVESVDLVAEVAMGAWALLFLLTGVLLAALVRTSWITMSRLGARDLRYGPWWSLTCWIIPVGNLFIPKQIVDDIWRSAEADVRMPRRSWYVRLWWASVLVAFGAERTATVGTGGGYALAAACSGVAAVLAAGVVIALVLRIAARAQREGLVLPRAELLRLLVAPRSPSWAAPALAAAALAVALVGTATAVPTGAQVPAAFSKLSSESPVLPKRPATGEAPLPFTLTGRGFSIAMPGRSTRKEWTETYDFGDVSLIADSFDDGTQHYAVTSAAFPADVELDVALALRSALDAFAEEHDGLGSIPVDGQTRGRPHREALVSVAGTQVKVRYVLHGRTMLELIAGPERLEAASTFDPWIATLQLSD